MTKHEYVSKICTSVLANVKANFELKGWHDLRPLMLVGCSRANITFIVNDIYGNELATNFKISVDDKREEIHIMDLSYKLLLWLNDITFDNRCDKWYN